MKIPALMNFWIINVNGKNYKKRKEESRTMKLPET
jgi:hypothetical protein